MPTKCIDLHQDLLLHIKRRDLFSDHWQTNFEYLPRSGVCVVIATAFPMPDNHDYFNPVTNQMIEQDFLEYQKQCENGSYHIIRSAQDFSWSLDQKLVSLILHVEGLNAFSSDDWEVLERWHQLGWRSLGIVWNVTNGLAGGTKDATTGLSTLGKDVLVWCENHGVITDFAHMNQQTFFDAVQVVTRPIFVSHGNAHALCPNPRNLTDEQLDCIQQSQGVLGVFFAKTFVTNKPIATIIDVADHVDYLVDRMGIEHVGIGSDFGGMISGCVDGLDSIEKISALWHELMSRGYTIQDVEKIAWQNAARVIEQHLISR